MQFTISYLHICLGGFPSCIYREILRSTGNLTLLQQSRKISQLFFWRIVIAVKISDPSGVVKTYKDKYVQNITSIEPKISQSPYLVAILLFTRLNPSSRLTQIQRLFLFFYSTQFVYPHFKKEFRQIYE